MKRRPSGELANIFFEKLEAVAVARASKLLSTKKQTSHKSLINNEKK